MRTPVARVAAVTVSMLSEIAQTLGGPLMLLVRRLGALTLASAAVAVRFLLEPEHTSSDTPNYSSAISSAIAGYEANNAMADSAPQQEVVNGWVAKDLLEVIAKAQNASLSPESAPRDDRVPAELLLVVLGLALLAFTTPRADSTPGPGRVPTSALPDPQGIRSPPIQSTEALTCSEVAATARCASLRRLSRLPIDSANGLPT